MFAGILSRYCLSVRWLVWLIGRSVSFLLPVLALIVAFEVFSRYVLDAPTLWAYDSSLFLFGYIAALGGAYAQQKKSHINIDIIYLKVSPTVRRIFNVFTIILAVGFLCVMASMCLEKFIECLEFGYRRQSEWAPEVSHFWLMMTVAAVVFIAQYSADFICDVYYLVTRKELIGAHAVIDEPTAEHQPDNAETKARNALDLNLKEEAL